MSTASAEAYSAQHLKHKLLDRYGHQKLFAEVNGHPDVVCLNSGMLNEIPTLREKVNRLSAQLVN